MNNFSAKPSIFTYAALHALGTAAYIALVALFFANAARLFDGAQEKTMLIPMAMLLLFVLSAAVTGSLVLGRPILWYLDGKKKEAVMLFGATIACLFAFTVIAFSLVAATRSAPVSIVNAPLGSVSTELDLHGRGLTSIPSNVFSQTSLLSLDLSQNRLTGAPPSQIGQLQNLVTLNLSHNALTGLPAELGRLSKLEVLDVSQNQLTGLPMELGNLTQLRILDVSGNAYSEQDLSAIAAKLPHTQIRR